MVETIVANSPAFLLTFARLGGLIGMNPLLNRKNIPNSVRAGLIFIMTILLAPNVSTNLVDNLNSLELALGMMKELFVGMACSYVFQVFYYMLFFAGDLMDMQFGMAMAKVFDPGTNIQMSVSTNWLNIIFVLFIFATDSHLLLIKLFADSFNILPLGMAVFSENSAKFFVDIFVTAFSLAVRLLIPFMAAEFVLESAMGILMKLIPQIHVFVINIQFKLALGLILLLAFASPISSFIDNYMRLMLENLQYAFSALS